MDNDFINAISDAIRRGDTSFLLGQAVTELHRIADAQEAVVELAKQDLEAQIEEAIQARAETLAEEISAEKTKRSFIGKR